MVGTLLGIFGIYATGVLTCQSYGRYIADGREADTWPSYFWSQPWVIVYTTLLTTVLLIAALSACAGVKGKTERYLCVVVGLGTVVAAETFLIYKKKQIFTPVKPPIRLI